MVLLFVLIMLKKKRTAGGILHRFKYSECIRNHYQCRDTVANDDNGRIDGGRKEGLSIEKNMENPKVEE